MNIPDGRFYKMYTDQRLDALTQLPLHKSASSLLTGKFSMGPADMPRFMVND